MAPQKNRMTFREFIDVIVSFLKLECLLIIVYLYFRNYNLGYNDRDKEQFMIQSMNEFTMLIYLGVIFHIKRESQSSGIVFDPQEILEKLQETRPLLFQIEALRYFAFWAYRKCGLIIIDWDHSCIQKIFMYYTTSKFFEQYYHSYIRVKISNLIDIKDYYELNLPAVIKLIYNIYEPIKAKWSDYMKRQMEIQEEKKEFEK